jgi:hypothetical protein
MGLKRLANTNGALDLPVSGIPGYHHPISEPEYVIEQSADFFAAPGCGQLAAYLRLDDLLVEPGLFQRPGVEQLQCRPRPLNGSPGKLPLVEQIQQKCVNVFRSKLISGCSDGSCVRRSCAAGDPPACAGVDVSWTPPWVSNTLSKCHRGITSRASGLVQIAKPLFQPR